MKIISLNCWGARVRPDIYEFIQKHAQDTDIFCFQEFYNDPSGKTLVQFTKGELHDINMLSNIQKILPDFNVYFASIMHEVYGIAMFVRKNIQTTYQEYQVAGPAQFIDFLELENADHARKIQILTTDNLTIVNFHGIWNALGGKHDIPARILQSERINSLLETVTTPVLIIGDFNLNPDTESLEMLTDGRRDLIAEYKITSTRTPRYAKPGSRFADYAIASKELNILDFRVLEDDVSDHAALLVEVGM